MQAIFNINYPLFGFNSHFSYMKSTLSVGLRMLNYNLNIIWHKVVPLSEFWLSSLWQSAIYPSN